MPDTRYSSLSELGQTGESPYERSLRRINEQIETLRSNISATQQTTQGTASALKALIDALNSSMDKLGIEVGRVADNMGRLSSSTAQNRQALEREAASIDDLWAAYKKMGVAVEKLEVDLDSLKFTEKEINKVVQLGTEYNNARSDSYTALSQKYRAVKILIDQMTVAERENTETGRQLVAQARDWYQQMNLLQQRTGKYQLQVGDYSKAMTGLNIATNQVVRELPVLANGVSMFAIAISNNIPILLDNIKAMKDDIAARKAMRAELEAQAAELEALGNVSAAEAKRTSANAVQITSVGKALAATIFSWQTALVLVLTVLPGLIRNIEKKKKAQEEDNQATKDAIEYEKLLTEAYNERDKEEVKTTTRLQVLYEVSQDATRATEDRIKAARLLKQEYKDEFDALSETEIMLGRAKTAYDNLTESLVTQAKARAYLNKITALQEQMIDQKALRDQAKAQKDAADAEVARLTVLDEQTRVLDDMGNYYSEYSASLGKAKKAQEDANVAFIRADAPLQDIDNAILKLTKDIPINGLLESVVNGPGAKEKGFNIKDYYNDALQALIDGMDESLQKRLALLDLAWKKEQESYERNRMELLRIQRDGNAKEKEEATIQLENLHFALLTLEQNYISARKALVEEMLDSYKEVVADEGDVVAKEQQIFAAGARAEKKLRDMAAYETYEASKRTAEDKEALDNALRESERQYWENYLADLRQAGILTIEEYNNIMNNLAKATKTNEDRMGRGRKGRRYGGIAEALMAQTSTYGETNKFGMKVVKEEYQDFANAVDSALKTSMKYMDEWMAKRLEMAEIAVEAAEKEVDAAKTALDYELEARNQGYANSVETARKELDLQRQNHKKALEEKAKVEEQQRMIDTATQISSLVTATANIWSAYTKAGMLGPFLAAAATAAMWGAFAAAQTKAAQVTKMKSQQYGEGTVELLEGGSHASGHDIDMGVGKDGTRRRAEGGEFFAIINKRNSRKYRKVIPDVINSFNDGTFGEKYYNANAAMGDFALGLLAGGSPTDVSKLERDVRAIREQGDENRYVDSRGNMVIRYKNLTRKYRKG